MGTYKCWVYSSYTFQYVFCLSCICSYMKSHLSNVLLAFTLSSIKRTRPDSVFIFAKYVYMQVLWPHGGFALGRFLQLQQITAKQRRKFWEGTLMIKAPATNHVAIFCQALSQDTFCGSIPTVCDKKKQTFALKRNYI